MKLVNLLTLIIFFLSSINMAFGEICHDEAAVQMGQDCHSPISQDNTNHLKAGAEDRHSDSHSGDLCLCGCHLPRVLSVVETSSTNVLPEALYLFKGFAIYSSNLLDSPPGVLYRPPIA